MKFDSPFPHWVFDNFLSEEEVFDILTEWPTRLKKENGKFSKKNSSADLRGSALRMASSERVIAAVAETGIEGLFQDPGFFGAGYHAIPRDGFLKMHVDFNVHPKGWHRRVNFLVYLNPGWKPEWKGQLQLGNGPDAIRIEPIAGRAVMFETNDASWHGHPEPLECPEGVERRSIALYFYSQNDAALEPHTTIYKKKK